VTEDEERENLKEHLHNKKLARAASANDFKKFSGITIIRNSIFNMKSYILQSDIRRLAFLFFFTGCMVSYASGFFYRVILASLESAKLDHKELNSKTA
jgi:hypothetical protein